MSVRGEGHGKQGRFALAILGLWVAVTLAGCGGPHSTAAPGAPPTGVNARTSAAAAQGVARTPRDVAPPRRLPISVQSDRQMHAAGNEGPSSAVLLPDACVLSGTIVTARGTYQGGFPPEAYSRYGDVVELYVFAAPVSGYPQGVQLGLLSAERPPVMAGPGVWRVSVPIDPSLGRPRMCLVAAQPTHDVQLAP